MTFKGQDKFINEWKLRIDGVEYIRCGKVNNFIRSFGIDPPKIYAMKLYDGHHYMRIKTAIMLLKALHSKYKKVVH